MLGGNDIRIARDREWRKAAPGKASRPLDRALFTRRCYLGVSRNEPGRRKINLVIRGAGTLRTVPSGVKGRRNLVNITARVLHQKYFSTREQYAYMGGLLKVKMTPVHSELPDVS